MKEAVSSPGVADIFRIGLTDLVVKPGPDLVGCYPFDPQLCGVPDNREPDKCFARVDEAQQRLVDSRLY
jgi:hypothetical protein